MTQDSPKAADLTLEEQVRLLSGQDFWSVAPLPRHDIGSLRVTDGPNGARGGGSLTGGVKSSAFPVGIALGATWNPALLREIGAGLAQEVKDKSAHVLLAPTVNLHRGPLNGRNFECYAEDPHLTAELAVAYIHGLQENGIAATIKHFVGNESEIERMTMSSDVDERTLRELYLVPFERAVKDAQTWGVMTSYNRLNGTYTSESEWLLETVLRKEWGFDGVVMRDWFGSHSTGPTVNAGLDLEMPGPARDRGDKLIAAVKEGSVPAENVERAADNMLRLMARTGALHDHSDRVEEAIERDSTRALIRRAGAEGMVLLKNEGALPFADDLHIAVIGPNARNARCMGGGSAQLNAHRKLSPWDGLEDALGANRLSFAAGCDNHQFEPVLTGDLRVDWFDNTDLSGDPVHTETIPEANTFILENPAAGKVDPKVFSLRLTGHFTASESGTHRIGLHAAGRARISVDGDETINQWDHWTKGTTFFEQGSNPETADLTLEKGQTTEIVMDFKSGGDEGLGIQAYYIGLGRPLDDSDITQAVETAKAADVALLCVGRSAEWDSEGADLPSMTLPGRQNELITEVAKVAKRTVVLLQTGGPVEMPWADQVDAILQAWYPGQEAGHAITDVLTGKTEPAGRLPQSFPHKLEDAPNIGHGDDVYPGKDGHVRYAEGLSIGYRHHDTGPAPLYPFGHGLGYAEIAIVDTETSAEEANAEVIVTLHNASDRDGQQVVQLYVAPEDAPVDRPQKELKAFAKVSVAAGGSETVALSLTPRDFAWFDVDHSAWVVSPGRYALRLGLSADTTDVVGHVTITQQQTFAP